MELRNGYKDSKRPAPSEKKPKGNGSKPPVKKIGSADTAKERVARATLQDQSALPDEMVSSSEEIPSATLGNKAGVEQEAIESQSADLKFWFKCLTAPKQNMLSEEDTIIHNLVGQGGLCPKDEVKRLKTYIEDINQIVLTLNDYTKAEGKYLFKGKKTAEAQADDLLEALHFTLFDPAVRDANLLKKHFEMMLSQKDRDADIPKEMANTFIDILDYLDHKSEENTETTPEATPEAMPLDENSEEVKSHKKLPRKLVWLETLLGEMAQEPKLLERIRNIRSEVQKYHESRPKSLSPSTSVERFKNAEVLLGDVLVSILKKKLSFDNANWKNVKLLAKFLSPKRAFAFQRVLTADLDSNKEKILEYALKKSLDNIGQLKSPLLEGLKFDILDLDALKMNIMKDAFSNGLKQTVSEDGKKGTAIGLLGDVVREADGIVKIMSQLVNEKMRAQEEEARQVEQQHIFEGLKGGVSVTVPYESIGSTMDPSAINE